MKHQEGLNTSIQQTNTCWICLFSERLLVSSVIWRTLRHLLMMQVIVGDQLKLRGARRGVQGAERE